MGLPAYQLPEATTPVSPEDYLRLESKSAYKHEYLNGRVVAMAGAEPAHNEINYNLNQVIGPQLRRQKCKGYMGDQRVQVKSQSGFLYPDTVAVCKPAFSDKAKPRSLTNPVFIAEVLSTSTADNDRGAKFMLYRQIPSLQQYLILDSESVHAELYSLDELGRWVLTETRDPQAVLDVSSIGCQVPLAAVYEGVELVPLA
ncbi:MAG: Uma2 family endonuclease [Hymenobacter sp.]|nr:MAG: Uma2 family endonuclease [Hymenobacter sp.]